MFLKTLQLPDHQQRAMVCSFDELDVWWRLKDMISWEDISMRQYLHLSFFSAYQLPVTYSSSTVRRSSLHHFLRHQPHFNPSYPLLIHLQRQWSWCIKSCESSGCIKSTKITTAADCESPIFGSKNWREDRGFFLLARPQCDETEIVSKLETLRKEEWPPFGCSKVRFHVFTYQHDATKGSSLISIPGQQGFKYRCCALPYCTRAVLSVVV